MSFQKSVLDNGITVISEFMPSVRSISLGLWFNVGSRDELPHQRGLAHFMEHMMFKGTPTRTPLDISMHFDRLGAEFNAFTSKEYTCFYARFVDEKLKSALEVLADMVINSSFDEEAITTEREVVLEEITRSYDAPDDFVFDFFSQSMMQNHPLGLPVLGDKEIVSNFTHSDCMAFHESHYGTGNLCIAVAGNVDHDELVSYVREYFSSMRVLKKASRDLSPVTFKSGIFSQKRDIEQAHIIGGFPSLPSGHEKRFALGMLTSILGGSMSARLFQEVREKRGLAYSIYATQGIFQGAGQWCVYAGTRPDNVGQVINLVRKELASLAEGNLDQDELDRNIDLICGQAVLGFETTSSHMMRLGKRETLGLPHLSIDESIQKFREVTCKDVVSMAEFIFDAKPTIAVVSPLEEGELLSLIEDESN